MFEAAVIRSNLVALRRALHREPEIGLDLPLTQARVLAALDGLPLEITLGRELSSVVAVLRGGRPGPAVLLRADMDALPVQETSGLPYASRIPGAMHACGHDLHTAALVGAARLFHAGTTDNVIPDEAEFAATVRSFSRESRERVREESLRVVRGIAAAHGLEVDAEFREGYPVTVNDPAETAFAVSVARELVGAERCVEMPHAITGSEDFGLLGEHVPSAYLMLGACPPELDPFTAAYNHSPVAAFDDSVLDAAAALLAALAMGRLGFRRT
ncbi:M20/M25/M40 family metallo-hydrolase [Streptomyces sp. NPDC048242]|uniref:M20 metallopeptidase family protein n=1 Tax=Streptomyces sp. NPDC048242 TaxID=3155026 RepID=UPI00342E32F0